jgi:hypothetical protein
MMDPTSYHSIKVSCYSTGNLAKTLESLPSWEAPLILRKLLILNGGHGIEPTDAGLQGLLAMELRGLESANTIDIIKLTT